MKIEKTIRKMAARALGTDFFRILDQEYFNEDDGCIRETEAAYQEAISALADIPEKMKRLLDEQSRCFTKNKIYAVRFSFACGQYSAFSQCLTPGPDDDDFSALVDKGLFEVPGMERHLDYIKNLDRINQIGDGLRADLGSKAEEHLISIECAMDERIYYAAIMAFYCGYQSSLHTIEHIKPSLRSSILSQPHFIRKSLFMGGPIPVWAQT